jgi:hypothetical protein
MPKDTDQNGATNRNNCTLIENYLDNNLDFPKRKQFEEQLKTNEYLQDEFFLRQEINKALSDVNVIEFISMLKEIHKTQHVFNKRLA